MGIVSAEARGGGDGNAFFWNDKHQLLEDKWANCGDIKITIKILRAAVNYLEVCGLWEQVVSGDRRVDNISVCLEFNLMQQRSLWEQHRTFQPESKVRKVFLYEQSRGKDRKRTKKECQRGRRKVRCDISERGENTVPEV